MIETAFLLILAHLVGDYPLQTQWILRNKVNAKGMAAHIGIHLVLIAIVLGQAPMLVLALAASHLVMDLIKTHLLPEGLWSYTLDQTVHFCAIGVVLLLGAQTRWVVSPQELAIIVALCGFLLATELCSPAIGYSLAHIGEKPADSQLVLSGRPFGMVERALVFTFILFGMAAGVAVLLAAKVLLQVQTGPRSPKANTYIFAGTLISFSAATVLAIGTMWVLENVVPTP